MIALKEWFKKRRLERIYRDVSEEKKRSYLAFCENHQIQKCKALSKEIEYLRGGSGETLCIISYFPEALYEAIQEFEKNYQVIVPYIPKQVWTVQDAIEGILAVLNLEQIQTAHFLSLDDGCAILQCLIRNYPQYIQSLILTPMELPNLAIAEQMYLIKKPYRLLLWITYLVFTFQLAKDHELTPFGKALLKDITTIDRLSREINNTHIIRDYHTHYIFQSEDLADWEGRMLIVESKVDKYNPLFQLQVEFKKMYPRAQILASSDDLGYEPIDEQQEFATFINNIKRFLSGEVLELNPFQSFKDFI